LACLAVTNDQFTLSTSNGNHRVDRLQTCEHRFTDGLPVHHAGRNTLERSELSAGVDRTASIKRTTERIDHSPDYFFTDGHRHNSLGAANLIAFFYILVGAEQHRSDFIFFEVERDSCDFARQIQKFAGHHTLEPVYFGDAVTGLNDSSYFSYFEARIVAFDLLADDLTYFVCPYSVHRCLPVEFLLPSGGAACYLPSLLSSERVVSCVELR